MDKKDRLVVCLSFLSFSLQEMLSETESCVSKPSLFVSNKNFLVIDFPFAFDRQKKRIEL